MNVNFNVEVKTVEELKTHFAKLIPFLENVPTEGRFSMALGFHTSYHHDYPTPTISTRASQEMAMKTQPIQKEEIVVAPIVETPKEKKAPKAKETKKEEVVEAPVETPKPIVEAKETKQTPKEDPTFTKDDIADACQKVSQTINLDAAKAVLAKFTSDKGEACRRISDVKKVDYAAFIVACSNELDNA